MPTDAQLRALVAQPDVELDYNDNVDREHFQAARQKLLFTFADQARASGAKTNGMDGIFLGKDVLGKEIWAHLVSGPGDKYVCDLPHRAVVLFQYINDMRAVAGVRAVPVSSLATFTEVAQWDAGIKGDTFVERFRFIYDALVEEAQSMSL